MIEEELIETFIKDIDTYPFKTRVRTEVACENGRIDIVLPDYDIAIEAKCDGSVKKAIGQAAWYSEVTGMDGYILLPPRKITRNVSKTSERCGVGIVTTTQSFANFALHTDVGGFESFHPKEYSRVKIPDVDVPCEWNEEIVGGL
jgi:hypothetical protein